MKKPIVLTIMDGYGINESEYGNAIKAAKTPNMDKYLTFFPNTKIGASGLDVGLPNGQMGNSEVGHTNIGAGRIIYQDITRISKYIEDGSFFTNAPLIKAIDNTVQNSTALHIMGLLSDGGVHSLNEHMYAILTMAKQRGAKDVYVHCFLDGRDVPPVSGAGYVQELIDKMAEIGVGKIATVMGRYYAMDRDNRWERVKKAYDAMAAGEGIKSSDAVASIKKSYETLDENGKYLTDEFVLPTVIEGGASVKKGDSVVFYNFRPDRAREITRAFVDPSFTGFDREKIDPLNFVCFTSYDASMPSVEVAFPPENNLEMNLGELLSKLGKTQLRIAETEKYPHVTFFFNGGTEAVYPGEERILVPSPKVATYDMQPEMSAYEVCDKVVDAIKSGRFDVIILNFANCDMVGHTGVFDAAVRAVETVDECVGRVVDSALSMGGAVLITADHGNADKMYEEDGSPFTAHTTNLVPFAVVGYDCTLREGGVLADIAPTILKIAGIDQPQQMTGKSIIL